MNTTPALKFETGRLVITPGAMSIEAEASLHNQRVCTECMTRHLSGDWGDLSDFDKKENDYALDKYLRIWSGYDTPFGRILIITEADRSATTILTPDEY